MLPILLAFISALFSAIANVLARRLARLDVDARDLIGFNFVVLALMLTPAAPLLWKLTLDSYSTPWLLLAIGLDGLANYGYFRSFKILDAATASSLMAVSPFFGLLLAPLFGSLSGGIHFGQVGAVIMLTVGVVIILGGYAAPRPVSGLNIRRESLYPLGAAFLFAASLYPMKILLDTDAINPYTYYFIRAAVIGAIAWGVLKPDMGWLNRSSASLTTGRLVFVIGQWLALLTAIQRGHPAVIQAVANLTPLFVLVFAWVMSAEKPNRRQMCGVAMIVAGAGILSSFSGS